LSFRRTQRKQVQRPATKADGKLRAWRCLGRFTGERLVATSLNPLAYDAGNAKYSDPTETRRLVPRYLGITQSSFGTFCSWPWARLPTPVTATLLRCFNLLTRHAFCPYYLSLTCAISGRANPLRLTELGSSTAVSLTNLDETKDSRLHPNPCD
jgi:hypothetical protein